MMYREWYFSLSHIWIYPYTDLPRMEIWDWSNLKSLFNDHIWKSSFSLSVTTFCRTRRTRGTCRTIIVPSWDTGGKLQKQINASSMRDTLHIYLIGFIDFAYNLVWSGSGLLGSNQASVLCWSLQKFNPQKLVRFFWQIYMYNGINPTSMVLIS